MDFTTRKNRQRPQAHVQTENLEALYPHNVQLYHIPPTQDVTLQTFEDLAVERLKVLRILEQASSKNLRPQSDEWKESVMNELNQAGLKSYIRLFGGNSTTNAKEADLQARKKDYISHFILRLAYCQSQDLRRYE